MRNLSPDQPFSRRALIAGLSLLSLGAVSRVVGAEKEFGTEVHLTVERAPGAKHSLSRSDEKRLREVLEARVETLAGKPGKVEMDTPGDIRVVIPSERVTPADLKALCRVGRLEVRLLQNVRTTTNPKARYYIDTLTIQSGRDTTSSLRIRDKETGQAVPLPEFAPKCPLLLNGADIGKEGARVVGSPPLIAVRVSFKPSVNQNVDYFAKPGTLLATLLDGELISVNAVEGISGGKRKKSDGVTELDLLGGFNTAEEAAALASCLNSGTLPVSLTAGDPKLVAL